MHKSKRLTKEINRNTTVERSVLSKFLGRIEPITSTWALILTLGIPTVITIVYKIWYQNSCKIYYHIPAQYFQSDSDDKIYSIFIMALIFSMIFLIQWMKKSFKTIQSGFLPTVGLIATIGIVFGVVNALFVYKVFEIVNTVNDVVLWMDNNAYLVFVVSSVFTAVGIAMLTYGEELINLLKQKVKSRYLKITIAIVAFSIFLCSIAPITLSMVFQITSGVETKRSYEIIEETSEVVLSVYEGKFLVTECEYDDDNLKILSHTYWFKPIGESKLKLLSFNSIEVQYE